VEAGALKATICRACIVFSSGEDLTFKDMLSPNPQGSSEWNLSLLGNSAEVNIEEVSVPLELGLQDEGSG
jgi:hypothetical protein